MRKYVTVAVIPALVIICLLLILLPGQVPLDTKEKPESLPVAADRTEAEEPAGAAPEEGTTERQPRSSDPAAAGSTDEGDSVARGIISGRITRSDGNPAGGAKVVAVAFADRGDATADENGAYRVDGLRPGKYTVAASL